MENDTSFDFEICIYLNFFYFHGFPQLLLFGHWQNSDQRLENCLWRKVLDEVLVELDYQEVMVRTENSSEVQREKFVFNSFILFRPEVKFCSLAQTFLTDFIQIFWLPGADILSTFRRTSVTEKWDIEEKRKRK